MTDSFTNRLRDTCENGVCVLGVNAHIVKCDNCEAADEIERLRADRDKWRGLAERAMELLEDANRILAGIQQAVNND